MFSCLRNKQRTLSSPSSPRTPLFDISKKELNLPRFYWPEGQPPPTPYLQESVSKAEGEFNKLATPLSYEDFGKVSVCSFLVCYAFIVSRVCLCLLKQIKVLHIYKPKHWGIARRIIIYIFWSFRPSFRPSVCSRLTFYWKELRSCNMAQDFRLLPAQIIGNLTSFFSFFFLFGYFFT